MSVKKTVTFLSQYRISIPWCCQLLRPSTQLSNCSISLILKQFDNHNSTFSCVIGFIAYFDDSIKQTLCYFCFKAQKKYIRFGREHRLFCFSELGVSFGQVVLSYLVGKKAGAIGVCAVLSPQQSCANSRLSALSFGKNRA